jgi:hypothetical protein
MHTDPHTDPILTPSLPFRRKRPERLINTGFAGEIAHKIAKTAGSL